jgi:Holliday junction resolvasome RuvABC endonuclease subunit
MKILSLDLGTTLGWAMLQSDGIHAGSTLLASDGNLRHAKKLRMDRRLDIRITALSQLLWGLTLPELIVFEDVRFASSQAQAHLWASFRGVVWTFAAREGVVIDCLDTSKLKLWTTGAGNATKEMMKVAACKRWPGVVTSGHDDNAIDAICLLKWAQETHR